MTHEEIDAMEAGPEMDRLVAEKAMGCRVLTLAESMDRAFGYDGSSGRLGEFFCGCPRTPHETADDGDGYNHWLTCYSTDLNAAVEACGKYAWTLRVFGDNHQAIISLSQLIASVEVCGYGPTPALALCRALLKATL